MGAITEREARLSLDRFKSDLVAGLMGVFALTGFHYRGAETTHRKALGTTATPDARLQLAVARDLYGQGLIEQFVAADKKLGEVAEIEGLPVLNPYYSLPA